MPDPAESLPLTAPATFGVLLTFLTIAPLAAVTALLVWTRRRRAAADDSQIIAALDRVLAQDSATLRRKRRGHPLRFRTQEHVRLEGAPMGWGLRPGRVEIVRTIRAATSAGYRLRLRAFARGPHGRTIVRSVDVHVLDRR